VGSNPATPTIYLPDIIDKKARLSVGLFCLKGEHKGSKRAYANIKSRKSPADCFSYVSVRGHAEMAPPDCYSEKFVGLTIAEAATKLGWCRFSESSLPPGGEISTSELMRWAGLCLNDTWIDVGGAEIYAVVANNLFLHSGESQTDRSLPTRPVSPGRADRCVETVRRARHKNLEAAAAFSRSGGFLFPIDGAASK
jgi:hypothetical protein